MTKEARALQKSADFQAESNEGQLYRTTEYKSQEPGGNVGRVTTEQLRRIRTTWNLSTPWNLQKMGKDLLPENIQFSGKVNKFLLILQSTFMAFLLSADTVPGGVNKTDAVLVI